MKKVLLIIFDGLADRPIEALGGMTPLEKAAHPNIDKLVKKGLLGEHNALPKGEYPTSEEAHFSIFGYDYKEDLPGRGVLEALGLGVPLKEDELVLRVDFGTVDAGLQVLDPRAGNIKSVKSFCEYLGEQEVGGLKFKIYPGLAHRAALVVSGAPVSACIRHHSTIVTDTDPHKAKNHRSGQAVLKPLAVDRSVEAQETAEKLWQYQLLTHRLLDEYVENKVRRRGGLLPANFLLTRGAGFIKPVTSFKDKYGLKGACVAGAPLYKGIASYFGLTVIDVPGATGGVDTDIEAKVKASLECFRQGYDFVFMHLKGTDVVAEEEGDFEQKMAFIERADRAFGSLVDFDGIIVITGDHATPCILKDHSDDPVPLLFSAGESGEESSFNERAAASGGLGHLKGTDIMPLIMRRIN